MSHPLDRQEVEGRQSGENDEACECEGICTCEVGDEYEPTEEDQ